MLEIIKEAGTILKDLPDLAIWILVGILFYKVFVIGGIISLIKFSIDKLYSYLIAPKEVITLYKVGDLFIRSDGTFKRFEKFLELIRTCRGSGSEYIHEQDVDFLIKAMREKTANDKAKI